MGPPSILFHEIYSVQCYSLEPLDEVSRIMRKLDFCLCENKGTDQLCSICKADQRLCFRYITIALLPKFEISSFLPVFVTVQARFVSDLVENPKDRFSRVAAQMKVAMFFSQSGSHYCQSMPYMVKGTFPYEFGS